MAVEFDKWDGLSGGMSNLAESKEAEITEGQRARWVKRKSHLITEVIKCSIFKAAIDGHTHLVVDKTTAAWASSFLPDWEEDVSKSLKDHGYALSWDRNHSALLIMWS